MDISVISSHQLPFAIGSSKNFGWCPTMDLISFQLSENALWIYRLGNQRVWNIELDEDQEIECLCWRPDGKVFAVISTQGHVNLFDSSSGKLMLKFKIGSSIETCSWYNRLSTFDTSNQFEKLFDMNLTNSLPKLTSSHSSKKLVNDDQLIKCEDSSLDFLIIGSENGLISIVLYGIFIIENFQLPQLANSYSTFLDIHSSKNLGSHYILVEKHDGLFIIKLATTFVETYGTLLPRVCLACSKLVGLLTYIKELIDDLENESKPFADYTTRILALLKSEIETKSNSEGADVDPVYDLYDLLLTGVMSEATKAWISDYLGDRGLKRWIKLGKQYFENSRKNLFYNLIPALEHTLVYLTDLNGLANWKENERTLGLQSQLLVEAIDLASDLLQALYRTMLRLNDEQQNFDSFVQWLNSILVEVTSGDKSSDIIKTKEVIEFLTKGLKTTGENNHELYDNLKDVCERFFDAIKSNMKLKMESSLVVKIGEVGSTHSSLKILGEEEFGLVVLQRDNCGELIKFDCETLDHSKQIFDFQELVTGKITNIVGKLLNDTELIFLVEHKSQETHSSVILVNIADTSMGTVLGSSIVKRVDYKEGFIPKYFAVNPLRRIGCLMDSSRKNYVIVEI
ncbi:hypothetical protein OGAPHI_000382 [Ogataea philodendri]|uniref:Anaphase-promoting complex subunit 4 n=1 Tax=Ogataea philodendri TaxID=1378263 RepID=A0A9P8PH29_9ASCO|nr:uncharacterized protein OGAPHI_000382 [Ogataea philodendri]KAH3671677.1 hypothetical protein OGAPHI_000382 [Ogataea philodendri]